MPTDQETQNLGAFSSMIRYAVWTVTQTLRDATDIELAQETRKTIGEAMHRLHLSTFQSKRDKSNIILPIDDVILDTRIKQFLTDATVADLVHDPELLNAARAIAQQRNPAYSQIVRHLKYSVETEQDVEDAVAKEMISERGLTVEALLDEDYRAVIKAYFARHYASFDPEFDLAFEMLEGQWSEDTDQLIDSNPSSDDAHQSQQKTGKANYG